MADEQIDDLNLDNEDDDSTESGTEGRPTARSTDLTPEAAKWKRRYKQLERQLHDRDISAFKAEFPALADDDLSGANLTQLRGLLSKIAAPSGEPVEVATTTPEIEDHKRFVATRGSSEAVEETYSARELKEMLDRGAITPFQMDELVRTRLRS